MSTQFLSPSRTPSKNPNVERLLSLQKSSKKLSDADILSFAAEASAMKRNALKTSGTDENSEPNRGVSKRLFDINQCSKSAAGVYSPDLKEKPEVQFVSGVDLAEDAEGSDSDIEAEAAVEKSVERIMDIVNSNAKKSLEKRQARRQATVAARDRAQPQNDHQDADAGFEDTAIDYPDSAPATAVPIETTTSVPSVGGSIRDMVVARTVLLL